MYAIIAVIVFLRVIILKNLISASILGANFANIENEIEKAAKILQEEMENACQMKVRLRADVNTGKTWYDAKS